MVHIEKNDATKNNLDIDWKALMELGEAQFDAMVTSGDWGKKTPQEEQLFALQTQVKALQAAAEKSKSGSPNFGGSQTETQGSQGSGKSKSCKKKWVHEDWQFKNPKNLTIMKKKVTIKGVEKEVDYHWCINHVKDGKKGMWVRHKPEDCKPRSKTMTEVVEHLHWSTFVHLQ